jgi:Right handed beta helix region
MSYTLRGRLESRLAASVLPFLVACALALALGAWWPLELAGAMIGAGLALDVGLYHRLLPYQPAWSAIPLGLVELTATMALVRLFDVAAPLEPALWFFLGSWVLAQVLGHAGWPLARLTYAEDGGELGRGGVALLVLAPTALVLVLGTAWATRPPTVHLAAGVHQGPIVIRTSQVLDGEPGTIVKGGIVIRASDVTVRDVAVVGGEYGIDVEHADGVRLENVSVSDAKLDGIHARRSSVTIRGCRIDSLGNRWAQGIDISFSFDKHPSRVTGCTVVGGLEGIVTHFTMAMIDRNHVSRTSLRAISMTEMSMGEISGNQVWDALGIGIFCNDMSMCDVDGNVVVATRPDRSSGDAARVGFGVLSSYHAEVELGDNELRANPVPVGVVADAHVVRK